MKSRQADSKGPSLKVLVQILFLIALVSLPSLLMPKQEVKPDYRVLLYSVANPGTLKLRQLGDLITVASNIHISHFTISKNCKIILSTGSDNQGPFVKITDMNRGELDAVLHANTFFNDEDVVSFENPSVGPDHRSFAVVGVKADELRTLYISDGVTSKPVYHWLGWSVTDMRWINSTSLMMEMKEDTSPFVYLQVNTSGSTSLSNLTAFRRLPYNQQGIYDHLPEGAEKALACNPAYRVPMVDSLPPKD